MVDVREGFANQGVFCVVLPVSAVLHVHQLGGQCVGLCVAPVAAGKDEFGEEFGCFAGFGGLVTEPYFQQSQCVAVKVLQVQFAHDADDVVVVHLRECAAVHPQVDDVAAADAAGAHVFCVVGEDVDELVFGCAESVAVGRFCLGCG